MRRAAGIGKESDSDLRAAGALRVGPDRPPGRRAEGGGLGRGFCRGKAQRRIPCIPSRLVSAEPLPARCSRPPFRPLRLLPLLPWLQRWWRDLCSLKTDQSSSLSLTSPASAPDLEFSPEQTENKSSPGYVSPGRFIFAQVRTLRKGGGKDEGLRNKDISTDKGIDIER